jgi:hypothetical protein
MELVDALAHCSRLGFAPISIEVSQPLFALHLTAWTEKFTSGHFGQARGETIGVVTKVASVAEQQHFRVVRFVAEDAFHIVFFFVRICRPESEIIVFVAQTHGEGEVFVLVTLQTEARPAWQSFDREGVALQPRGSRMQ